MKKMNPSELFKFILKKLPQTDPEVLEIQNLLADYRFIDLDPIVLQEPTDIFCISANGLGSYKETRVQLLTYVNFNTPPIGNVYYVSPNGNDAGTGSQDSPWQTYSNITLKLAPLASASNPFTVVFLDAVYGTGVENIPQYPYIIYDFGNSIVNYNSFYLDSSWNLLLLKSKINSRDILTKKFKFIKNDGSSQLLDWLKRKNDLVRINDINSVYTGIYCTGQMNVANFNYVTTGITNLDAAVFLKGFQININSTLTAQGDPSTGSLYIQFLDSWNLFGSVDSIVQDCISVVTNIALNSLTVNNTGSNQTLALTLNAFIGPIVLNGTGSAGALIYLFSTPTLGGLEINGNSAAFLDASSFSYVPTGTSAQQYTLVSIANGINSNYTGINYTNLDPANSVEGALAAIDLALGLITADISLQEAYDNGNTITLTLGRPVYFGNPGGGDIGIQDSTVDPRLLKVESTIQTSAPFPVMSDVQFTAIAPITGAGVFDIDKNTYAFFDGSANQLLATQAYVLNLLTAGSYVPALFGVSGVSTIVLSSARFLKVGSILDISIGVMVTVTASTFQFSFAMVPGFTVTPGSVTPAGGWLTTSTPNAADGNLVAMVPDTANNRVQVSGNATVGSGTKFVYASCKVSV